MRRLIAAAGFALLASTALAADLPAYEAAPMVAPVPTTYDWTGFYIGVNGGYGWGDSNFKFKDVGTSSRTDFDGGLAGGQIGANLQLGGFLGGGVVIGIEGDIDWTDISGSDACHNPAFDCNVDINYLASVRGRLGYAFDRFLVYGTGGVGFGDVDYNIRPNVGGGGRFRGSSDTQVGWVAGGGVELGFWRNWSVKGEYNHFDLGTQNTSIGDLSNLTRTDVDLKVDTVKFGINYRF